MNKDNIIDKHKQFIDKNHWLKDIDFNNIDIIECKEVYLYCFILSLIENKVIQCNILIPPNKNRYYYNGKHYFNKERSVSYNNNIYDYLRDYNGNILFRCEDKNGYWCDYKNIFEPYNNFNIDIEVKQEKLKITYNE